MAVTTQAKQILIKALEAGDDQLPDRFWELVERYRGELVNQALAITGNLADAEEVTQETFCEAFGQQKKLASVRSLGAWLRAINRANALNRIRHNRTDREHTARKQNESPKRMITTGGFNALEVREQVAQSVETLPPKMRSVVVLRYLEHFSYKEIAQRLQVSEGTVGWLLCEAGMQLHGKLNGFFGSSGPASDPAQAEHPDVQD